MVLFFSKPLKLISLVSLCLGVGVIGGIVTIPQVKYWYPLLKKPVFTPPDWVFGPIWTILYLIMALSAFLVWSSTENPNKQKALCWFSIQLGLNAVWSPVFFGSHQIFLGLWIIIALWISLLVTIFQFFKISKLAAYLLFPYIFWVSYATALNFEIWRLNPS